MRLIFKSSALLGAELGPLAPLEHRLRQLHRLLAHLDALHGLDLLHALQLG